jgi:hypothetical protein
MAETLTPLAPPPAMASAPVAPVASPIQNAQPIAPISPAPVTQAIVTANPKDQADSAIASKDPIALDSFSRRYANTPEGQATAELSKRIKEGQSEFQRITKDVNINTPEGRLAALKSYKTSRDEPRYGDALMMYIAGDKIGAMQTITGGKIETKIEYLPSTGRMVEKKINALGEPVSVRDLESDIIIPMQEYAKLGGSVSALENTLYWKSREAEQKFNTEENNKANKAYNAISIAATSKAPLVDRYTNIMEELMKSPDLSVDDRQKIAGFTSGAISDAKSIQDGRDFIDSATRTKGNSLSAEDRKALGLGYGPISEDQLRKALSANANVQLSDKAGNTFSSNTLLQLMDRSNVGRQLDKSYQQTQDNLREAAKIGLFRKKPELFTKLEEALNLSKQIQTINATVAADHGNPLFTVPTTAAAMRDPNQRVLAQAVQEQFNVDVAKEFNAWRTKQMDQAKSIRSDYVPEPGELENAFTQTAWYKNKQKETSQKIVDVINRPYIAAPSTNIPQGMVSITGDDERAMNKGKPKSVSPAGQLNAEEEAKRKKELSEKRKNLLKEHTTGGR